MCVFIRVKTKVRTRDLSAKRLPLDTAASGRDSVLRRVLVSYDTKFFRRRDRHDRRSRIFLLLLLLVFVYLS